jgi:hypothetical protein
MEELPGEGNDARHRPEENVPSVLQLATWAVVHGDAIISSPSAPVSLVALEQLTRKFDQNLGVKRRKRCVAI